MKVLVSGGAGFIGSHVAEYYVRQRHKVIVFGNLSKVNMMGIEGRKCTHNWEYLISQ